MTPGEQGRTVELRLRAAVESSPSGLLMVDADGRIVLVNREIERLFGYAREELLGRPVESLVPQRYRGHHAAFRGGFHRDPKVRSMGAGRDLYGLHKNGTEVPVEIGLTPVATEEGLFILGAVVDITARKQAEEERRRLEEQLRQAQKMEAIGTLAGGVAHDFNNILASIVGFAELIRPAVQGRPGAVADVDELLRAAERGKDLVTRILRFSRRQPTDRQPLDLGRSVSEAAQLLRATLPAAIEMRLRLPEQPQRVSADATSVHQVLMNLATNAAHAMAQGGLLEVAVEPLYLRDSMARSHPDLREGPYVRLGVTDSGTGIEPALLDRVFEPFFTTKPTGSGSGLGLAMVHGIMRDHDGAVILSSEVGRGTQVFCYFPALETEGGEVAVETGDLPGGRGERVLLVDDERSLAIVGERRLQSLGYAAVAATDPFSALELLARDPTSVDLVITDYSMPRMNGLDFARQVQRIRPGLPVLLSTGFAEELPEGALGEAGIRAVLGKPASMRDLAIAVRNALAGS